MSSPSERIREARERLGLEPSEVAAAAGLNYDAYFDVEHCDDEATSNISLDQLIVIGRLIGLTPLGILEGSGFPAPARRVSLAELAGRAAERMAGEGMSAYEYGERVGWEMAPVFTDPETIRTYTVDALRDICREVGIDWHEAPPAALDEPTG